MVRTSIVFLRLFSFSLLHLWLKGVVAFDFHKVNTIPRFDATQSIICSGDGLTLLRSTNNLQQRDIWYEFSSGTYPSAFNVRMPQHIRYPLLSMETFPNDGAVNCTKIHSSSQEASFLASIVLHDIQLNSQAIDLQGWSFQPIQWKHQQSFEVSIAETTSENRLLSISMLHSTLSVANEDLLLVPNNSLWLIQVYNNQQSHLEQVELRLFLLSCAEQFLWYDLTNYNFPYVSIRNNYRTFEEARTSNHPHPYISWYPFLWIDGYKSQNLNWNYSEPTFEERQQVDLWNLGDEYNVGILKLSVDVSRLEWKQFTVGLSIGYATVPPFVDKWTRRMEEILVASVTTTIAILVFICYCRFQRREESQGASMSAPKFQPHHRCLPISEESIPLLYKNSYFDAKD